MTIRPIAPAIVLLALASAGCDIKVGEGGNLSVGVAEGKATDEWVRRYPMNPAGKVEIINTFGSIEVFKVTGAELEVTAARELRLRTPEEAQAALKDLQMIESASADLVRIESPTQNAAGRERSRNGFLSVNYRIGVPSGLAVTLRTENGQVKAESVDGTVSAATTNGSVTVKDPGGAVDARTVNGNVNIDVTGALKGPITVNGVNGRLRLSLPVAVDAELALGAVNGNVSLDDAFDKGLSGDARRERQRLSGRLNKGGHLISAQIVNGGVRLENESR